MVSSLTEESLEMVAQSLSDEGYFIWDNFLNPEEIKDLHGIAHGQFHKGRFKKAGIGKNQDHKVITRIRGDYIRWVEPDQALPPTRAYMDKLRELMAYLNRSCFLGLKDMELHYAVYPKGTGYERHVDQFRADTHRRISVVTYLNPVWKPEYAGQLRLYLEDQEAGQYKDVFPMPGRMVCFRSEGFPHEVLPATKSRYSITGWLLDQLHDLPFNQ